MQLYTLNFPSKNTGLDQIIEASTYQSNATAQVSRYLVKFPTSQIDEMFNDQKLQMGNMKSIFKKL